jgi:hypothetical protein
MPRCPAESGKGSKGGTTAARDPKPGNNAQVASRGRTEAAKRDERCRFMVGGTFGVQQKSFFAVAIIG